MLIAMFRGDAAAVVYDRRKTFLAKCLTSGASCDIIKTTKGDGIMTNWTKIDEQWIGLIGYEDFISDDGKLCKRVWYDGEEETFEISE